MKFYFAKASSALVVHVMLEELGAEYEAVEVPIATGAHLTPEYLALNPKGRVPALQVGDTVISENPAILTYLAETHPQAGLLPDTALERAVANGFMAYLCATMHVAFAHLLRGKRWADDPAVIEALKLKVGPNLRDCAALIESHYLRGPWVMGERYTLCDPYLFLVHRWLGPAGVDIADYPKIAAHKAAMLERPATRRAMAAHGL